MAEVPQPPATAYWRKTTLSGANECAEVASTLEHVFVRDSKDPLGPVLGFTRGGWSAFVVAAKRNEFGDASPSA